MPSIAYHTSKTNESTKESHVSYRVRWDYYPDCTAWDEETGQCTSWGSPYYHSSGTEYADADIEEGTVQSSKNIYINGKPVACVGDDVAEEWSAEIPESTQQRAIDEISPASSGSGTGTITRGSSKVFVNGKAVSFVGAEVTTHLDSKTTVKDGSNNVFISQ